MGQTYVDITATEIEDGIMTIAASGGGQETGSAWIYWNDSGFTGRGWYWEDPNNGVRIGWEAAVADEGGYINKCNGNADGTPHTGSLPDFEYHVSQRHSENLDYILNNWSTESKMTFIVFHPELKESGCVVWQ